MRTDKFEEFRDLVLDFLAGGSFTEDYILAFCATSGFDEAAARKYFHKCIRDGYIQTGVDGCVKLTNTGRNIILRSHESYTAESEKELQERESRAFDTCMTNKVNRETRIYRYVRQSVFEKMICNGTNAFSNFYQWDDPYERVLHNALVQIDDGTKGEYATVKRIYNSKYVQCWTLNGRESDVLWRAYANGKRGNMVRIESTVGKIFDSLGNIEPKNRLHICLKMGAVKYYSKSEIDGTYEKLDTESILGLSCGDMGDLLFQKRLEFSEEEEFRFIIDTGYYPSDQRRTLVLNTDATLASYQVDWRMLITGILFDPFMTQSDISKIKSILGKFGWTTSDLGKVRKSDLCEVGSLIV